MAWEAVFDRIGGLWAGVAAIVGFWVANRFELRRDALQAERDRDREWRDRQRSDIANLQHALQRLADATSGATIMLTQINSGLYPVGKDGVLREPWYLEWTSSAQAVLVLKTHVESATLLGMVDKVLYQAQLMIASSRKQGDLTNPQAGIDEFAALHDEIQVLTRSAQAFAGNIYQDLNRPPVNRDNRSRLCRRLC
jgi:hypothetical protein